MKFESFSRKVSAVIFACSVFSCSAFGQPTLAERAERGEFEALLEQAANNQVVATLNVFFGRSDLNAELTPLARASRACSTDGARVASGREWVLANARDTKVLMFNENHYGLAERVFVRTLLAELRAAGFSHIGLEAMDHDVVKMGGRYRPAADFYTREPTFAALIREVESTGFEIFGYEPSIKQSDDLDAAERFALRESGQANNIQARIEAAPDDARFIIFAGWSHIAKQPVSAPGGPGKWMAARFMENTGIDPLAIDLTACAYEAEHPENWQGRILLGEDGTPLVFGRDAHAFDAQIRLPVPPRDHPVATGFYRQTLGQAVGVPEALRPDDKPALVQARKIHGPDNEVAHDRVLLYPGEDPSLYLVPGQYELQSHRGDGEIVGRKRMLVE